MSDTQNSSAGEDGSTDSGDAGCCSSDDEFPLEIVDCTSMPFYGNEEALGDYADRLSGMPRDRNGDRGAWWMERWVAALPGGSSPCSWYRALFARHVRGIVHRFPERCSDLVAGVGTISSCGIAAPEISALEACGDRAGAHELLCAKLFDCPENDPALIASIYGCTPPEQEPAP